MTSETFFSNIHYLVVFLLVYDVALLTVLLVYIMICCLLQLAFDIPIVCTSGIHVLVFDALLHVQLVFDVHVVYTSGLCIVWCFCACSVGFFIWCPSCLHIWYIWWFVFCLFSWFQMHQYFAHFGIFYNLLLIQLVSYVLLCCTCTSGILDALFHVQLMFDVAVFCTYDIFYVLSPVQLVSDVHACFPW